MTSRRYHGFIDDSDRWNELDLRDGDIIIDTPPKCGTTWMQMCCALLIFQQPELPRPLSDLSPWVDMLTWPIDELVALLDAQTHRRFMKTHTPLDGVPWDPKLTYICVGRDPRDAMLSMESHMANMDMNAVLAAREKAVGLDDLDPSQMPTPPPDDPIERFWWWVDDRSPADARVLGLAGVLEHLQTFWDRRDEPNVALFHYSDLRADLDGQMRRLAHVLDIEVPGHRWDELVHAASFAEMKQRADVLVPDLEHGIWHDNSQFFDQGRSGRWHALIGDDALPRYDARVAELVSPELAHWAHHGWLDSPA